jgi:hypothetical protein
MSEHSNIQWCDSTVNPVMGCAVDCELRPAPAKVRAEISRFFANEFPAEEYPQGQEIIARILDELISDCNATEMHQLRNVICDKIVNALGKTTV